MEVSNLFLDEGRIVSTRGRTGQEEAYDADPRRVALGSTNDCPMVVLINKFSAIASEIVAAALQDHKRAVVIGERTFGKGSVQTVVRMENGASAMKLTTASYERPSGKNIHRFPDAKDTDDWGVKPDTEFDISMKDDERLDFILYRRDRDIIHGKPGVALPPRPKTEKKDGDKEKKPFEDRVLQKALEHLRDTVKK